MNSFQIVLLGAIVLVGIGIGVLAVSDHFQGKNNLSEIGRSVFDWRWTKKLAYWIITSAGTMAELVFLLASLWMSINSSVHNFVLLFMSEQATVQVSYFANTAFVGLPECVSLLAVVITIGHIRTFCYNRRDWVELVWSIAYGIPTLFFVVLSFFTIGFSIAQIGFQMPEPLIIARALAGYTFGFVAYLHMQTGVPQEVDRLRKKDGKISELQEETARLNALLQSETDRLTALINQQTGELQKQKRQQAELITAINKTSEDGLQAYSDDCVSWLKSGIKSASVQDITRYTGLTTAKVNNAVRRGELKVAPNNKELVLISALVPWLQSLPPITTKVEVETGPILRVVNR